MTRAAARISIAGAGAIGCFIGAHLAAAGHRVTLWGRERVLAPIRDRGLTVSGYDGQRRVLPPTALRLETEAGPALRDADAVLVAVKSAATAAIAAQIAAHAPPGAVVISLQNGLDNIDTLRAALPGHDTRAGMVGFNVVPAGPAHWHRAVSGAVAIEAGPGGWARRLAAPGLELQETAAIAALQRGKLILNLNNALNALSGLALRDQLLDRGWRRLMADQMAEALAVLRAARLPVRATTPLPAAAGPALLRLPTPLFRRIAARMLVIDPRARTSMAHDIAAGRPTEIDSLQGWIVDLGARCGRPAPIAAHVAQMVRATTAAGVTAPAFTPAELRPDRGAGGG